MKLTPYEKTPNEIKRILKVHKIENFFGSEFEFCTISLLVLLKYEDFVNRNFILGHEWGDRIVPLSLRLRGIDFSLV
jgi:hypothetical protein